VKTGEDTTVGISDFRLYVPPPSIELKELVAKRVLLNPRLDRHLERACRVTGQKVIRFPEIWEDSATLAATAAYRMLQDNPGLDPRTLRHLAVGTETGGDHAKPLSAYLLGMLQRAGIDLPGSLSSFEVKHACAGGTMALLSTAGMLAAGGRPRDSALVISTDIARYETESTAEITQGAGAVAVHVETTPRLLEIELSTLGFHSMDVDDFFRPYGSETARVNGTYSMRCYGESLEAAFLDHCSRRGERPDRALRDTDYFILHTPFRNMPESAMARLLDRVLGLDSDGVRTFLAERSFAAAVDPFAQIGNLHRLPHRRARIPAVGEISRHRAGDHRQTPAPCLVRFGQHNGGDVGPGCPGRRERRVPLEYRPGLHLRPGRHLRRVRGLDVGSRATGAAGTAHGKRKTAAECLHALRHTQGWIP